MSVSLSFEFIDVLFIVLRFKYIKFGQMLIFYCLLLSLSSFTCRIVKEVEERRITI